MSRLSIIAAALLVTFAANASAAPSQNAAIADPPRDSAFPAHNQQLLVPSHGVGMNGLLFVASGKGLHPTVILMHGLPGNERNLDLAQAMRRAGWDVLTFTYRGAWGSPGDFSITHAMEDTAAALDFARSPAGAKFGIDPHHIVLAGHSMGGATALMTAAGAKGLDGLILIDAWDIGRAAHQARAQMVAHMDDFGNSLHDATPETVADEVLSGGRQWDLAASAKRLAGLRVLTITARYGLGRGNLPVTAAMRAAGARVTAIEMDTDHPFSDHRIALSKAVVNWLQSLPVRQ